MTGKIVFKEHSYRIIGACFEVYKEKGNGFLEAVYQECLVRELVPCSILFCTLIADGPRSGPYQTQAFIPANQGGMRH